MTREGGSITITRRVWPMAASMALHGAVWLGYVLYATQFVPAQAPRRVEVALFTQRLQPPAPVAPPAPPPPPAPVPKPVTKPTPKKAPPKPQPVVQPQPQVPVDVAPSTTPVPEPPAFVEADYRSASLNNPPTRYPRAALERHWEGRVLLRVQVLANGSAGEVAVEKSSGHEVLDASASEQVKSWRFVPARERSGPLDSWVIIPIEFKIKR